jgi:hypothetical protein
MLFQKLNHSYIFQKYKKEKIDDNSIHINDDDDDDDDDDDENEDVFHLVSCYYHFSFFHY